MDPFNPGLVDFRKIQLSLKSQLSTYETKCRIIFLFCCRKMSEVNIGDIPDLALSLIASYLDVEDLLSFRAVNKSLYNASLRLNILGNIIISLDRSANDIESLSRFLLQDNDATKKVLFKISRAFDSRHWKYSYMSRLVLLQINNIDIFQDVCCKCLLLESLTYIYKKTDFRGGGNRSDNLLKDAQCLSRLKNLNHFTFDGNDSFIPMSIFMQVIKSVHYLTTLELHSIVFFNETGICKDALQLAISRMTNLCRWEQNNVYFPYVDISPPACVREVVMDIDVPYDNHDSDASNDEWHRPSFSLINLNHHPQLERLALSQSGGPHIDDSEIISWDLNIYSNFKSLKLHSVSLSEDYLLCRHLRDLSLWKCDGVRNYLLRLSAMCTLERITLMDIDKFRDTDLVRVVNKMKGLRELRLWSMNSLTCAILSSFKVASLRLVEIYDCKHIDNNEVGIRCIHALRKVLHFTIKVEKEKLLSL